MTSTLSQADWNDLCQQAPVTVPQDLALDDFEQVMGVPESIGRGYNCGSELLPGLWLSFCDCEYHQDFAVRAPAHEHPIQIGVHLSGCIYFDEVHPNLGRDRSYFSGSGVSPAYVEKYRRGERLTYLNVEFAPELLANLMVGGQYPSDRLEQLFKGEDWKVSFYPKATPTVRSLAKQLWNAPYQGTVKRLYLQAKVLELLAVHLDAIASDQKQTPPGLKPATIDCLYHARDILNRQLENPPSLLELAQQVGLSDRTLQRGFQTLFQTSVVGYLTQQRLEQAEKLLRQGNLKVSEVATAVGYGNMGHFAVAFKRRFGITPRQCLAGHKI